MRVDIWSDVICPWCYVGKARGVQHALLGAVNEAYFAQARDIFDRKVLTGELFSKALDRPGTARADGHGECHARA